MSEGLERAKYYALANKILVDECRVISGFVAPKNHVWNKRVRMYPVDRLHGTSFNYIDVIPN
jgi:hypothetical protein